MENKREIMAQIVALLTQLIGNESDTQKDKPPERSAEPVEMLTIKECTRAVSGLSEHTVRQLVAQHKIPYIRHKDRSGQAWEDTYQQNSIA